MQTLALDCFGNRTDTKDGKNAICKDCRREYKKAWRKTERGKIAHAKHNKKRGRAIKLWLLEMCGSTKCIYCGESHPACLDFHHRDAAEKEFVIASAKTKNREILLAEIKKCDVVCANCHRKLHWV